MSISSNSSYSYYLLLGKDANSNVTYQIPFPYSGNAVNLIPATESNVTVPPNMDSAFFSYTNGSDVWVDGANTLAAVPNGDTTAELNPVARPVFGGQVLSFYSMDTCIAKVSFYSSKLGIS